jgi:hypothetical protein
MDDFLGFPGTKFRFGLDPIIGLLPGIGDVASAIISALALVYAARYGLPKILLTRMATNILVNELVGIIPGLGDAFSFWFKSNVRNYELLRRCAAAPERSEEAIGYSSRSSDSAFHYRLRGFDCEPARVAGYLAINFRAVNQTKRTHSLTRRL